MNDTRINISSPLLFDHSDFMMGDPVMDAQHRELIDSINDLYQARFTFNHDQVKKILTTLINNTKEHFILEEAEMEAVGYPEAKAHAAEHKILMDVGNHFLLRFDSEEDIAEDLQKFLLSWLTNHILYSDRKVVNFCESLHRNAAVI